MTHGVIGYVIEDAKVVDTMDRDSTVERVMDGIVANVRVVDSANHMEVNGVRSENKSLTDLGKLTRVDAADGGLISRGVANNDCTILVVRRVLIITLELDVAGEKSNFSAHLDRVLIVTSAESLNTSVVLSK